MVRKFAEPVTYTMGGTTRYARTRAIIARNREIRDWARARGYDVKDRGLVPAAVLRAWNLRHQVPDSGTERRPAAEPSPAAREEEGVG